MKLSPCSEWVLGELHRVYQGAGVRGAEVGGGGDHHHHYNYNNHNNNYYNYYHNNYHHDHN